MQTFSEVRRTQTKHIETDYGYGKANKKAMNIQESLDWIHWYLGPFLFVEFEKSRQNCRLQPIARNSLNEVYGSHYSGTPEDRKILPEKFALLFHECRFC